MAAETSGIPADGLRGPLTRLAGTRRTLPELQDELFLDIGDVSRKLSKFWILLMLAATIATSGILTDSTATVIGAMIVAPLGTPIMGMALAVVIGEAPRLIRSAALVLHRVITLCSCELTVSDEIERNYQATVPEIPSLPVGDGTDARIAIRDNDRVTPWIRCDSLLRGIGSARHDRGLRPGAVKLSAPR